MVDENEPLTKEERRQRKKQLEQTLRRRRNQKKLPAQNEVTPSVDAEECRTENRRGRSLQPKLTAADVQGWKYFEQITPLLERLHDVGCERDKAGNRDFHFDQMCSLLLLGLFTPLVTSLRGLQQASELERVQQRLGVNRVSLGSFSEAARVFDAELLKPIIQELGQQLKPLDRDPRLKDISATVTLVDGSLLSALPQLVQAMWLKEQTGSGLVKWRLHTHFEVDGYIPTRIDVTPNGGGEHDERSVLERTIEADRLYVMDRGYAKFALFNKIVKADSSYVCRLRDNSVFVVTEERPLSDADRAAGVLSDQLVNLGLSSKKESQPDHQIRLVCVKCSPHTSRGKYRGGSTGVDSDGLLRIATNLLDVPAEIIGLLYSWRWTIEIFFRFLKHLLGCHHLYFHSQNGIQLQVYCAIIVCMLISLWTGRRPTKRTFEMVGYYFLGLATEAELLAHLEKLKRQDSAQRQA